MFNKILLLFSTLLFIFSCTVEPKPIEYGDDKCDFCTMNIMDKPYATELVSEKGKVYKFDSTECMLNFIRDNSQPFTYILTNTMDKPGVLTDATTAYYLISENLPSPMGANITAFSTKETAQDAKEEHQGHIFNFEELKSKQIGNHHSH